MGLPLPSVPHSLLEAMAREEGFYAQGEEPNRPQRNNNPLDLTFCDETKVAGATSGDPRFAIFPDAETGFKAAAHWLEIPAHFAYGEQYTNEPVSGRKLMHGYAGAQLKELINRFAPSSENNVSSYVSNVCKWTGLKPDDIVTRDVIYGHFTKQQS